MFINLLLNIIILFFSGTSKEQVTQDYELRIKNAANGLQVI
jgi:hypothetical protein